jgi:hypothetical protein
MKQQKVKRTTAKSKPLFAEVEFKDGQTVLRIYDHMPVDKLKRLVAAIDKVVDEEGVPEM